MKAICEMSLTEIREELQDIQNELLDLSIDEKYRMWCVRRCEALCFEIVERDEA